MSKKTYTNTADFAAYAHKVGPAQLLAEMISNGTPTNVAYYALDQLFGDQPEFCPTCHQEIVDEDC